MDFMNNPNWIAGLANMAGRNPQEALLNHAKLQESQVRQRAAEQEMLRQQQEDKRRQQIRSQSETIMRNLEGKPKSERVDLLRGIGYTLQEALKFDNDMFGAGGGTSDMKTFDYYKGLSPEDQRAFMKVKRADKYIDRGSEVIGVDPITGEVAAIYEKDLAPEQLPETKAAQASAAKYGTVQGEAKAKLKSMESKQPQLEEVVEELEVLADKATYSVAGVARDAYLRQTGQEMSEGGKARAAYVAKIDNVVLPLLRDTFGAAFTKAEGDSLRATLGDVSKSPEEKKAVLDAFIAQKKRTLKSLAKQTNKPSETKVLNGTTYEKIDGEWHVK